MSSLNLTQASMRVAVVEVFVVVDVGINFHFVTTHTFSLLNLMIRMLYITSHFN